MPSWSRTTRRRTGLTARRRTGPALRPRGLARLRLLGVAGLLAGSAVFIALIAPAASAAGSASTSSESSPDAEYYVSTVTAIQPATTGLDVAVHGSGEYITLTNNTGHRVIVVGYSGEDYLRITSTKAELNTNSLTAALNSDQGQSALPKRLAGKGKSLPAKWQQVSTSNTVTWRDYRTRWAAEQRPPIVRQQPHESHQVFAWAIQLKVNNQPTLVRGTVTWTGTPAPSRAVLAAIVGGGLLLALLLTLVFIRQRRRRQIRASHNDFRALPGHDSTPPDSTTSDLATKSAGSRY